MEQTHYSIPVTLYLFDPVRETDPVIIDVPKHPGGTIDIMDVVRRLRRVGHNVYGRLTYSTTKNRAIKECGQYPPEKGRRKSYYFIPYAEIAEGLILHCKDGDLDVNKMQEKTKGESRSIIEMIMYSKLWSDICSLSDTKSVMTTKEAADRVGLNMKTLYDYKRQLSLAKAFGFDFEVNRDKKVGFLRSFIRKRETSSQ